MDRMNKDYIEGLVTLADELRLSVNAYQNIRLESRWDTLYSKFNYLIGYIEALKRDEK